LHEIIHDNAVRLINIVTSTIITLKSAPFPRLIIKKYEGVSKSFRPGRLER